MYKNLRDVLRSKGISNKRYAEFLGVSEKSASNKINQITEFTYIEFSKTCKILLPEYNPDYLFTSMKSA